MIDKEHKFCIGKADHSWEVGYDKGYQQGRADATKELPTKLYYDGWNDGYKQGKANAIDEFAELLLKHKSKDDYPIVCVDEFTVRRFVEQLKEQK